VVVSGRTVVKEKHQRGVCISMVGVVKNVAEPNGSEPNMRSRSRT